MATHTIAGLALHALRGVRLLEQGMLGRARPNACAAVRSAVAIARDDVWCMRCGVPLPSVIADGACVNRVNCVNNCVNIGEGPRCQSCEVHPQFDAFIRLGQYRHPLDALVRRSKESAWHAALWELGWALGEEAQARLRRPISDWCVVAIPTSPLRRLQRGIDQSRQLADAVALRLRAERVNALRMAWTSRQAFLDREARLGRTDRIRASMRKRAKICGRTVMLVDDIRTTGSTLQEACKVLRFMGAQAVVPCVVCVVEIRQNT